MKNLINWLKSVFSKIQKLKDKFIPISVKIVQGVKKAINNGTVSVISDVLKVVLPDVGDLIVDKVEEYLIDKIPELCVELEIINAVNLSDKSEEAILQSINALSQTYGDKWSQFMSGLAGEIASYLSDGKLDAKEAKKLAGSFYDNYIKNKKL